MPIGKALHDHEHTPDEVFALGKSEVERISIVMEKVKEEAGFKGELKDFFEAFATTRNCGHSKQPTKLLPLQYYL